jgi:hypothetical protein
MNKKQAKTLKEIFEKPTKADISFYDAAALLNAIGVDMKTGDGSRVRFVKDKRILKIHKPHPQPIQKNMQWKRSGNFWSLWGLGDERLQLSSYWSLLAFILSVNLAF